MRKRLLCVAVSLVAAACGSTGPPGGAHSELERNEALWRANRPQAYVFAVERLCFCGQEAIGPVRVRVEGGVVSERRYVDGGELVAESFAELFPSVEGIFDIVRSAILGGAHEVRVSYDPSSGAPTEVWIDYSEMVADEELGFRITEGVEALPPSL